ncbi:MAG: polyhydroxyalkanoic acid system family protein [Pirellulales bacterium]|nr:polyhydroxyalkanoic acid system family protein [Pirellulales bacterium]
MPRPVSATIPHQLGAEEARRRISEGFGNVQRQIAAGPLSAVAFQPRWEGNRLHLEGGALGQRITGRVDVLSDCVRIELDLPEILAALAERITGKLTGETRKLLEKK